MQILKCKVWKYMQYTQQSGLELFHLSLENIHNFYKMKQILSSDERIEQ